MSMLSFIVAPVTNCQNVEVGLHGEYFEMPKFQPMPAPVSTAQLIDMYPLIYGMPNWQRVRKIGEGQIETRAEVTKYNKHCFLLSAAISATLYKNVALNSWVQVIGYWGIFTI